MADRRLLRFIVNETDKRVAAQVPLFLSADARAVGLLASAATLAAAGVATAASTFGKPEQSVLFASAVAFSVTAVVASGLAVWSLWPCEVDMPGWEPDIFMDDISKGRTFSQVEPEIAALSQRRLDRQRRALLVLGTRARICMITLACAPIFAGSAGLFAANAPGIGILTATLGLTVVLIAAAHRYLAIRRHDHEMS